MIFPPLWNIIFYVSLKCLVPMKIAQFNVETSAKGGKEASSPELRL